jgi:hypothetical protein
MVFASISIRIQCHSEQSDLMNLPAHRAELPGDVDIMIIRSASLPAYKAGHPADLPVNLMKTKGGATKSI